MSFILDALKKSESERRDRTGPELAYAPGSAEREALPRWVVALAILLLVNLVVVGTLFLVNRQEPVASRQDTQASPAAIPVVPPPARADRPDTSTNRNTALGNAAPETSAVPAAGQAQASPAGGGAARSLQEEAASAQAPSQGVPDSVAGADDTLMPAVPAEPEPAAMAAPEAMTGEAIPPTLSELQGQGLLMNLPTLGVDLHVYAAQPEARFVFINLNRYREGERLREGPLVERITPDGVIMQHEGRRFLLPRS